MLEDPATDPFSNCLTALNKIDSEANLFYASLRERGSTVSGKESTETASRGNLPVAASGKVSRFTTYLLPVFLFLL